MHLFDALAAAVPSADLLYPFSLGLLAAVNPCGFPLLPVYLDFFVGRPEHAPTAVRLQRAVVAGGCATLGFVVLFGVLGLITELGVSVLSSRVPFAAGVVMVALGVGMVGVGVATLLRHPLRLHLPELGSGVGLRRPVGLAVFGLSYGVASIGCSFPLFAGVVAGSFTRNGPLHGVGSLLAYAFGMGVFLAAMALVAAALGPAGVRSLRWLSRIVPYVGGAVLVLVGAYLTLYWVTDLVAPGTSSAPLRWVARVQAAVSSFVGTHVTLVGAVLGGLVVAAVGAGGLLARPRSRPPADPAGPALRRAVATESAEEGPTELEATLEG
ncbi:MAG: cytochrome c biogenesis CcdA family protein [Acidimicrobiales bacterium]